ncbi:hypothetical protein D3C85_1625710 [compost metagenome]
MMATKAVMNAGVVATWRLPSLPASAMSSGLGDNATWHSPRLSFCRRTLASVVMAKISGSTAGLPAK